MSHVIANYPLAYDSDMTVNAEDIIAVEVQVEAGVPDDITPVLGQGPAPVPVLVHAPTLAHQGDHTVFFAP